MKKDPAYREKVQKDLLLRLKRIEGQVRGVARMIEGQSSCSEVLTQLAAIKAAVNQVALITLACHLVDELAAGLAGGRELQDIMAEYMRVLRKLT